MPAIKPTLIAAAATALLATGPVSAGCLAGAAVGGVAGHYAGHHAVGAAAGCWYGHHRAIVAKRQAAAAAAGIRG